MTLSKFQRVCAKNISGCQSLFLAEAGNIISVTVTGGEVSALNACMAFKEIEADPHSISWEPGSEKVNKNNQFYKNSLSFSITKPTLSTNTFKSALADASPGGVMAIVTDGNSQNWLIGYSEEDIKYRPLRLASDIQVTGKTLRDDAGGTIKFILQNSCAGKALPFDASLNTAINSMTALFIEDSIITDYDGNIYSAISIGTQCWMVENLKTIHYKNGNVIPNLTVNGDWAADSTGAYCWYNNDIGYKADYGALYNWFAVNNVNGLAPDGWRVATLADYDTLMVFLGGISVAGGKMKEIGLTHWITPNTGATNESGFTLRAGGGRTSTGSFEILLYYARLWASQPEYSSPNGWYFYAYTYDDNIVRTYWNKKCGNSVRCILDT